MFSACQFTPEISSMIQARHEFAADRRHPSVTVSRAGLQEVWIEAWLGLASGPAGNRHVTVLASQGETWPRSRMPRRGAKSWTDPCHDRTGVGCR